MTDLQRYSEFAPTSWDHHIDVEDIEDWFVAPVFRNRDSGVLENSNWDVVLDDLGGESDTVQIHRFGHWACGWFEIIVVAPDSAARTTAASWAQRLKDYPIADEMHYAQRQQESAEQYWKDASISERIQIAAAHNISIFAARRDTLPDCEEATDLVTYLAE